MYITDKSMYRKDRCDKSKCELFKLGVMEVHVIWKTNSKSLCKQIFVSSGLGPKSGHQSFHLDRKTYQAKYLRKRKEQDVT